MKAYINDIHTNKTHLGRKIIEKDTNKSNILCKCCPPSSSIHEVLKLSKKGAEINHMSPSLAPPNMSHINTT